MASKSGRKSAFAIYSKNGPTISEAETTTPEHKKGITPNTEQDTMNTRKSARIGMKKKKSFQKEKRGNKRPIVEFPESDLSNASGNSDLDEDVPEMIIDGKIEEIDIQDTNGGMFEDSKADSSCDEESHQKNEKRTNSARKCKGPPTKKPKLMKRPSFPAASQSHTETPSASCGNEVAENIFKWLIHPFSPTDFFSNIFEKQPFFIKRENDSYFKGLYSSKEFEKIIKENTLHIGIQMDVTKYEDEERQPVESEDTLSPNLIWDYFFNGYTLRMRNPQVYHKGLWKTCSLLQEYFCSSVGANMYLTPSNSQGFPPHWDDIDAFILQIEGSKHWKVYKPSEKKDMLPRFSSKDLLEEDLDEPCLEVDVEQGDLLYIPRGFVHQAFASEEHSLHITLSTNQLCTWADFFEKTLPKVLKSASEKFVSLRKSLPKDFYEHVGKAFAPEGNEESSPGRQMFDIQVKKHLMRIFNDFDIDEAADIYAATQFLHPCMPPFITKSEADLSSHGNGFRFENGVVKACPVLEAESKVRWIRRRAIRLIIDEEGPKLHHTLSNNKNSREDPLVFIPLEDWSVPAISHLFKKHPEFVAVKDLPSYGSSSDNLQLMQELYDNGLLITEEPLPCLPEELT